MNATNVAINTKLSMNEYGLISGMEQLEVTMLKINQYSLNPFIQRLFERVPILKLIL